MRPTIQILEPGQIKVVLAEAKRILAETGIDIRGRGDAPAPARTGSTTRTAACCSRPRSSTARSRPRPSRSRCTTATASRTPSSAATTSTYVPGSSGLKIQDHRTGETRLSNSTDFIEYARLCDGLDHIAYLATAFSTNKDIESQVSDAWRLYMLLTTRRSRWSPARSPSTACRACAT